jgi:F0F1-type ATP synthase assembly protein I
MPESPQKGSPAARLKRVVRRLSGSSIEQDAGVYRYVGLGLTFALSIVLFFGLGYLLDKRLGTLPIFSLIGAFLGGIGGFLHIYRSVVRESEQKPPE